MKTEVIKVKGMSCSHCERAVNGAVREIEGVIDVKANAEAGTAEVTFDENSVALDIIKAAIEEEGYDVVN